VLPQPGVSPVPQAAPTPAQGEFFNPYNLPADWVPPPAVPDNTGTPVAPDRAWDYLPTYLAKLARVRGWLNALPAGTSVLDAGCGEGVLVEEFAGRLAIEGVDANYASAHVQRGSLLA